MKTLRDLLEHQIKDLYSAEDQLLKALPKMRDAANDSKLKDAFESHLIETNQQRDRIVEVCDKLGISPTGEECKAMKGLINEAEHFLKEDASEDVRDAGLIAEAQRIEHYEISGYGTAVRFAKELELDQVAEILSTTLDEEYEADEKLTDMAEDRLNRKAIS
ncbi:Protein YciF [Flagellimonas maritima]|uniref:Protein YciF n=1 Tax=Flagellimonas maritima TaxID=1383885 RepID=A0A2Z4LU04_9FLAO|nr:ferritin-like domain-containing protein [Allomuricauda aurantiaca]AWX45306.1 Protein YciF [Allomuricauda aurantiaca]